MNISDLMLNTPLGAILIIALLVLAAIAAWGAYTNRPGAKLETAPPTPAQRPNLTPEPPKKEEPKHIAAPTTPEKKEPVPCPYKEEDPCAKEREEIARLKGELETAKANSNTKQGEVDDLTGRLSNANRKLEELGREKAKPTKPQKVTADNILTLLNDLGVINFSAAKQLRAEAKKPQPEYARVEKQLEVFADYLEQRGYERPDPGAIEQQLKEALKQ